MKQEEVSKAINSDQEVVYEGGKYRVAGYQVIKGLDGKKKRSLILLDLKNKRTHVFVGLDDV
jgi:hypothetical protein